MLRLVIVALVGEVIAQTSDSCSKWTNCKNLQPLDRTLEHTYDGQPAYANFGPTPAAARRLDNVCYTLFKLPNQQYQYYFSRVYVNGTKEVITNIVKQVANGTFQGARPFCAFKQLIFAETGCDTNIQYRCYEDGGCPGELFDKDYDVVFGITRIPKPITSKCLCQVKKIIRDKGLKVQGLYALPMKLPTNCITSQQCTIPSNNNQTGCTLY